MSNVNQDIGIAYGTCFDNGSRLTRPNIRAKRIVAERASRGFTYELLLRDLIGDDAEKRNRSLVSLRYLHEHGKE